MKYLFLILSLFIFSCDNNSNIDGYQPPNLDCDNPLNDYQDETGICCPDDEKDCNIHNSKEWQVQPKKNMVIFFPSYLEHSILNNTSKKPRHSLAFNLIPFGKYGVGDSTYNTEWFK